VKSFCSVPNILRFLKDFILFVEKEEELQKIILRQHQATQKRAAVGEHMDWRGGGYGGPDARVIDGERTIRVATFQRQQCFMPRQMAIEDAVAVVSRQPFTEKAIRCTRIALLEQGMGKGMGTMGILSAQPKRAFGQKSPVLQVAGFGVRPPQVCEEPPILPVMPGVTLANRNARRIVIGSTGESIEAVGAEQRSQHQYVAREFFQVVFGTGNRFCRPTFDRRSKDLHMLTLAFARSGRKLSGPRRHRPRLGIFRVQLMQPRPGDVCESKIRVGGDRAIKRFAASNPR